MRAMKRLYEHGEHLGLNLEETERVAILMGNINADIFRHQIAMFRDPVQRLSMPHFGSFDDLIEALSSFVRMTDDAVLIRAQDRGRAESSFVVSETGHDTSELKNACHISGAVGTNFHFARECPLRDKKNQWQRTLRTLRRILARSKRSVIKSSTRRSANGMQSLVRDRCRAMEIDFKSRRKGKRRPR